jgi:hypothetical protein
MQRASSPVSRCAADPPLSSEAASWGGFSSLVHERIVGIFLFLPLFGKQLDYLLPVWLLGHTV